MNSNIPRFVAIQDHPYLIRDTRTMGIINTNRSGLAAIQYRREQLQKQQTLSQQQKIEINSLRNEVAELKELMLKLLERESNGT